MSRKIIPYPCDYKNTTSVRRARRGGNVLVLILCILIALLLGAGAYFVTSDHYRALKNMEASYENALDNLKRGILPPEEQHKPADSEAQPAVTPASTEAPAIEPAPTETPEIEPAPTEAPVTTPAPTEEPTATPMPTIEAPDIIVPVVTPAPSPDPQYRERMAQPFDAEALASLPDIIDACSPGVVGILNYQPSRFSLELQPTYSGTGFIITADGYIVTNQHVIEDARKLTVVLHTGEEFEATLIGSDVMSDVAVLKIEKEDLHPLPIGDSESIRVGEFVLAIGNPISTNELYGSVTFGIISAKARQINIDGFQNEFLQTDAAINPGNSGGPLINMKGEVIGVTNAKYFTAGVDENGNTLHSEGIGFALPMNNVMTIVDSLIQNGAVPRPGIGIMIGTRTPAAALQQNKPAGVYVDSVTEGGPADVAGMKVGDILKALDGVEMTQDEMIEHIRAKKIGDQITFTVLRGEETLEIVITVGDLNQMH